MRRFLLNAATLFSLAIFFAVIGLYHSAWGLSPTFEWPLGDAAGGIVLKRTPLRWNLDYAYHVLLLIFAMLPVARIVRLSWNRLTIASRGELGQCPQCGYDLRATPDRCPECGTISAKGAS